MDPFAHTLFGAALAETGLRHTTRHATAVLLIGANLPDIDILAQFWGSDAALYARRGWTHGVLAMVVLPLLLAGAFLLWHRWRGRRIADGPPLRPGWLLGIACVAVWSHPLLDWMNTYGVRLLMPFDGRWFHGDTLFIVDPWVWLLLAAGVVVARSTHRAALAAWVALAGMASWLVLSRGLPVGVPIAWGIGVAAIVLLRWRLPPTAAARVALAGVAAVVLYSGIVFGLARQAEARAIERFPGAQTVQANPMPGQPFAHRIVLAHTDRYRVIEADGRVLELPRTPMDDVVRSALADPSIRGFANWTRFPWWQVDETPDGWRVRFYDLRYARPGAGDAGIGHAEVTLPR
jgi:inner membrane protein